MSKSSRKPRRGVFSRIMAGNLKEMAQKMAQAARKGVALERKRLKEILAERQKKPASSSR